MGEYSSRAKASRLGRLIHLLYRNPKGLTACEISTDSGTTLRRAPRDRHDLEGMGVPLCQGGYPPRYSVVEGYYLPPVHLDLDDAMTLFLAARLLALTVDSYEIPADFDGPKLLSTAWGIWYGDEAEEVVLRFCASATRRLRETQWHPSQALEDCADGGVILRLKLAHPVEMASWIRGWGPQVEVLAPADLRAQLAEEAARTAAVYRREGCS